LSFASFIARRITLKSNRTFSKLIVRIAIIGIMLGLGVMILSVAIVRGFKQQITDKVRGFDGDIKIVNYDLNNSYENSAFQTDDTLFTAAKRSPLITNIMPFATKPGIIKVNGEIEGVLLKGVDKTYDWSFFKSNMVAGRLIDFKDTTESKKELMISEITAHRLNLKVGDKLLMYFVQIPLKERRFKVTGIFSTGVEDIDKTYVVCDLALIKKLNNWPDHIIGGYELRVSDFELLTPAAGFIDNQLPPRLKAYTVVESYAAIFDWLKLLDVNTQIILVLMLMVAVINMISALLIMILERTTMIGIFKAMGARNWSIQKIFLYNAAYLVGLGILFGNMFGLGLGFLQLKTQLFKLDPESYYMSVVPIKFNLTDVVMLNIGTLIICLLVLVIPSMLVSRISPVKAIRFK
jgi:lipoprotein-releasing system permease protein